ncbi:MULTISPECIES: pyruvate, water dikinase regulatory protein [unclassified Shewanella]|uniref:posphoenolpyruvate synthetase regulatory kinase/phosphorylase PpsR n=1 Tax=unclassified Shewanella TaxID=196818 RepID=UPI000C85442C|nr:MULTISPECIES: pyruvate, water dikinase regulatory protein [unclassified Shewanella]MDO6618811.1 pyruvate, water dikinase regulatory protein [Shewanella sp. 6_MG-2023]MDO6640364.1 pyruvate, water dikinase regulatory protein [Shewanella sp. 5_MG-2023]MDO6677826.1 pyruvate, water dikinase regulatory protein [Shewanella sp. 4_MG-2023]MDO6775203.1 pyruvate, water dikinase regulatory protein [Shewanella sp. 3_MG-2023]PMG29707.1 phosphoenolpyruvate synthase regulatory protein [Shewanella sp. 10N.2
MTPKVFYISDGTAITAEVFGHAVLSQFPVDFEALTIPFVDSIAKAEKVKQQINDSFITTSLRPVVFHSIVNSDIRDIIFSSEGLDYDFLNTFVSPLEQQLGIKAAPVINRTHGKSTTNESYDNRIDAINFTLDNDDGQTMKHMDKADIILLGVSRCGKTPSSLYLSMQFGIKAANYPFVEDDMDNLKLPEALKRNKSKLFGLTIDPQRLHEIRQGRMENSRYSSLRQCRIEVKEVEMMYKKERIPFVNTTSHSVEEISAKILDITGLKRHMF